jgi:ATP-dependent protease ClpP protease subunit
MFHPASGGLRGQVENMDSQLKMIKTLVDRLDAKITTRSGINYKDFKNRSTSTAPPSA